jgi:hypothetical protein
MIATLQAIQDKFGVSEPVFRGELSRDDTEISFNVLKDYAPSKEGVTDPVELLMIDGYGERFDARDGVFKKDDRCISVYRGLFGTLIKIYENNSPLKNPKQSKLSKWLYSACDKYNAEYAEGIISLYRYAHPFTNGTRNYRFENQYKQHADNVIAILEKMRDKYER